MRKDELIEGMLVRYKPGYGHGGLAIAISRAMSHTVNVKDRWTQKKTGEKVVTEIALAVFSGDDREADRPDAEWTPAWADSARYLHHIGVGSVSALASAERAKRKALGEAYKKHDEDTRKNLDVLRAAGFELLFSSETSTTPYTPPKRGNIKVHLWQDRPPTIELSLGNLTDEMIAKLIAVAEAQP